METGPETLTEIQFAKKNDVNIPILNSFMVKQHKHIRKTNVVGRTFLHLPVLLVDVRC